MPTLSASDAAATARLFHALSDEIRVRVIELLQGGERCVCELTDELGLAQSRLSWHLKTLKDAGFITDRREGRWVYYALDREVFEETQQALRELTPRGRRLTVRETGCCD
jgi:ArsR family transcriptional regulator